MTVPYIVHKILRSGGVLDEGSPSIGSAWAAQPSNVHNQQMFPCPGCGQWLTWGTLACPHCRTLVYREQLQQLSNEAMQLEQTDPARAAMLWQQCLALLPPDSQQYAPIYHRIGALAGGWTPAADAELGNAQTLAYGVRPRENDPWPLAVGKTVGSM